MLAQKDVTTFLGIPVDGYKSEMRKKLISKGFTPKSSDGKEYFEGEFNGTDVQLVIATNNNKVFRIMLSDVNNLDEANIRIRFNNLISQFKRNKRYFSLSASIIPDNEDISYEMNVNNKIYEAAFYQKPDTTKIDFDALMLQAKEELQDKYTERQLNNPTKEIQAEITALAIIKEYELATNKLVWFRINKFFGKYYIVMYYDNEYNHADGEDL